MEHKRNEAARVKHGCLDKADREIECEDRHQDAHLLGGTLSMPAITPTEDSVLLGRLSRLAIRTVTHDVCSSTFFCSSWITFSMFTTKKRGQRNDNVQFQEATLDTLKWQCNNVHLVAVCLVFENMNCLWRNDAVATERHKY